MMPSRGAKAPASEAPLKHVVEQYRHAAQTVTCVCGWQGSSASLPPALSSWAAHVRDSKLARR